MIFRSIVAAVAFFLIWMVAIRYLPVELDASQTMWGENIIHAQDYLFSDIASTDLVMVGSSISENLTVEEVDGRRVRNLGLSGQGVNDGLNVIMGADKLPAYVLVEMNVVMQAENEQFRKVVLDPAANLTRKYLPVLRQRYQPVGVLKGLASGKRTAAEVNDLLKDRPINKMSLNQKIKDYSKGINSDELTKVLGALSVRLQRLRAQGVEVLFYELPVHPALCQAPKSLAIREAFYAAFPPSEFSYVAQPECANYSTTDGLHLGERSNADYSAFLVEEIGRLIK
ncbi:MAG: hypothetical protein AB8H12_19605 [Lewinella sp.]